MMYIAGPWEAMVRIGYETTTIPFELGRDMAESEVKVKILDFLKKHHPGEEIVFVTARRNP